METNSLAKKLGPWFKVEMSVRTDVSNQIVASQKSIMANMKEVKLSM